MNQDRRPSPWKGRIARASLTALAALLLCSPSSAGREEGKELLVYRDSRGRWVQVSSYWDVPPPSREEARLVARVARVPAFDQVVLASGRKVRLLGIGLPDPYVLPAGFAERARARLDDLAREKWVHVEPEDPGDLAGRGELKGYLWVPGGICLNEVLLEEGKALLFLERPRLKRRDPLLAAARAAQAARAGWFGRKGAARNPSGPLPFFKGGVVGLYYTDPALSYEKHLADVKAAGAEWVSFLFTGFVERVDSTYVDRFGPKTVRDERLEKTVMQAREKGLGVMFLPIVHLRHMGEEDWRGTLRPTDPEAWFRSYLAFILHYADLAQAWGAGIFSGGSEFCSLESRETFWRWVFRNLRGRFAGYLTYSFNWDHAEEVRFQDMLDFVGMTAYWSLTKKDDPSLEELARAWGKIRRSVGDLQRRLKKPIVFTELGYPSQDGSNKDPWNYAMNPDRVDLAEQAACLEAFARTFRDPGFLAGVFFFDWFERGGPEDPSYSPQGKPALEVIRRFFRRAPAIWTPPLPGKNPEGGPRRAR